MGILSRLSLFVPGMIVPRIKPVGRIFEISDSLFTSSLLILVRMSGFSRFAQRSQYFSTSVAGYKNIAIAEREERKIQKSSLILVRTRLARFKPDAGECGSILSSQ